MVEERIISIRLLAAGILRNIAPLPLPSAASAVDIDRQVALPLVTPVISSVSLTDAAAQVYELISKPSVDPVADKPSLKHAPKADHKSPTEMALDRIEAKLRNVQLSLEILTGICATLPDPEEVEDEDGDDPENDEDVEEESEEDPDADVDMDDAPTDSEAQLDIKVNGSGVPQRALLPNLLSPLLALIQPNQLSFPPVQSGSASADPLPAHPPTTSALSAIHISALECLNNACLALALEEQERKTGSPSIPKRTDADEGRSIWASLWSALSVVGIEGGRGQQKRKEMWEAAVGVMWGVGSIWKGCIVSCPVCCNA